MRRFFHNNGLTVVLLSFFLFTLAGQYFTGFSEYNEDLKTQGKAEVTYIGYFGEGHFIETVFENRES